MKHHLPLLLAWVGVGVSAAGESLSHPHPVTLVGAVLASVASAVAIFVRLNEWRRVQLEREHLKQEICEECRKGFPPSECPYDHIPENCPKRKQN